MLIAMIALREIKLSTLPTMRLKKNPSPKRISNTKPPPIKFIKKLLFVNYYLA